MAVKEVDKTNITYYKKEMWGWSINRDGRQYGASVGNVDTMSQFLDIGEDDRERDMVNFTETYVVPEARRVDSFPPYVNCYKYGFGKAKS